MTRKVEIEKATDADLREFARNTLGLEVHPQLGRAKTLAAIESAAWTHEFVIVDDLPSEKPEAATPKGYDGPIPSAAYPDLKVRIIIQKTQEVGGAQAVPLLVNGVCMLVPRAKPVDIPWKYYHVLDNAVAHHYEMMPDGKNINPVPVATHLYPHSVLGPSASFPDYVETPRGKAPKPVTSVAA